MASFTAASQPGRQIKRQKGQSSAPRPQRPLVSSLLTCSLPVQARLPLDAEQVVRLVQHVGAGPRRAGAPAAGHGGGGGAGARGRGQRRTGVLWFQTGAQTQEVLLHAGRQVRQGGRDTQSRLWREQRGGWVSSHRDAFLQSLHPAAKHQAVQLAGQPMKMNQLALMTVMTESTLTIHRCIMGCSNKAVVSASLVFLSTAAQNKSQFNEVSVMSSVITHGDFS